MKKLIYIASLLYTVSSFSQTKKNITKNIKAGVKDIQSVTSKIEASNTIENSATAIYKSGESIELTEGFFADVGSEVFMTIEEGTVNNFSKKEVTETNDVDFLGNTISVYPNPSNGLFTVQGIDQFTSYSVSNIFGKEISTSEVSDNEFQIDITSFASGFYLLELQKENGEIIKKKIIKK